MITAVIAFVRALSLELEDVASTYGSAGNPEDDRTAVIIREVAHAIVRVANRTLLA